MAQIHLITLSYIIITLIQLYFLFRYLIPFVFSKKQVGTSQQNKESVSIVICAHNELLNLQKNLASFLNQQFDNFEVVLVNDRSDDGSKEWLNAQEKLAPHLTVVHIEETPDNYNPKKYALTKGIEAAQNEILLLSDADCQPASVYWVDRMSQSFTKSTSIVLGVSLYEKRKGFLNQFINFETLQTALLYLSFAYKNEPYMGVGRNLAYRKSFFLAQGGFEDISSIMGGDDDLWVNSHATKDNVAICTQPESLTFSTPKETWRSFFRQKKRHLSVGKHYKTKDLWSLGIFHFTQSMVWIIFLLSWVLGSPANYLVLISLFLLRLLGQYVVFYKLSIKFGIKFTHYSLPCLEILFIGYYWIWGIYASLTKQLKWK